MSAYDEYVKSLKESGELQKQSQDLSTKAQLDQLTENKKLVEAEKQTAFRGAYVDYAKNINPYGVQSELAYGSGLGGAGKGETAQANYYNTYQNRLGEINTNVTNQLRDIANQETAVRIAGDQAKLGIDTRVGQQLAAAQREDTLRAEQYAREDKNNAYTRIMNAISAGYNPTDEELAAAGMTRNEANAYKSAYSRSLYSGSGSGGGSTKLSTSDYERLESQLEFYAGKQDINSAIRLLSQSGISEADFDFYMDQYFPDKIKTDDGTVYEKIIDNNGVPSYQKTEYVVGRRRYRLQEDGTYK